ncbi:MAG: MotA/TolQ/ExbB proton channel family protein, partial [Candidatus Jordarchaeales archaeon]
MYRASGDCAPAFGMVGTLIGMVQMFANMTDPSKLGPFMAIALLATLYGATVANLLCLSLFDSQGFRGARHSFGTHKVVEIGPSAATPGFLPGPLPAGRWLLEVDTFMVLPGTPVSYRAEVRLGSDPEPAGAGPAPSTVWRPQPLLRREPGWYRGDLHTHTIHADGDETVAGPLDLARRRGLHFVALTDHNTTSQLFDPALDGSRALLIIPGMELTLRLPVEAAQAVVLREPVSRAMMSHALAILGSIPAELPKDYRER